MRECHQYPCKHNESTQSEHRFSDTHALNVACLISNTRICLPAAATKNGIDSAVTLPGSVTSNLSRMASSPRFSAVDKSLDCSICKIEKAQLHDDLPIDTSSNLPKAGTVSSCIIIQMKSGREHW